MTGGPVVTPCTNVLGAVVEGVDLKDLSDEDLAAVDRALLDHQVLFFRDQDLSDDEHLAFAARYGERPAFTPA